MQNPVIDSRKSNKISFSIFSSSRNALYGIAAISIIIFHFTFGYANVGENEFAVLLSKTYNDYIGSLGVEWFVFLSGIGLFFSMSKDSNIISFYLKRCVRILIPYLIIGSIHWIIVDLIINHSISLFLYDFFFISFIVEGNTRFWYVIFAIVLYIIYPFIFKLLQKIKASIYLDSLYALVFLSASIFINILLLILSRNLYQNISIAICRLIIFSLGCCIGVLVYMDKKVSVINIIKICLGFAIFPLSKTNVFSLLSTFRFADCFWAISLLFVFSIIINKNKKGFLIRILSFLGSISCELYLAHISLIGIFNAFKLNVYIWYIYLPFVVCLGIIYAILIQKISSVIFKK